MYPDDEIAHHFRLMAPQVSALRRLEIYTIRDLLYHFPSRFERAGSSGTTSTLVPGAKVTLMGELGKLEAKKLWRSRRAATEGWFSDAHGKVKVMWFNQPYIAKMAPQGMLVKLTGTVGGSTDRPYISNPEVVALPAGTVVEEGLFESPSTSPLEPSTSLFPIYPETRGITSKWFYHALKRIFSARAHEHILDPLPEDIRTRYHLPDIATSLIYMHTPEDEKHTVAARKRFAFEEIFSIHVARARERAENTLQPSFRLEEARALAERFLDAAPFTPTGAQRRAVREITLDMQKPYPGARLLEGDVGSGKTLVAAACAFAVVHTRPPGRNSGTLQVAYMAPTEILATQHFNSFIEYFRELPISIALITGSGCKKFPSKARKEQATDISRTQLLKWVRSGEIAMVVGTHALIQKSVEFQHLALCIVDEQHRFGTRQRRALARKGDVLPHFLSMTATPIPRTLALTIYGDLDLSVLDELPRGRAQVKTKLILPSARAEAYEKVRDEIKKGRQAYVICPRIEEPDPAKLNAVIAKSVKAEAARLKKDVFSEYHIEILHGALKSAEKERVLARFAKGDIHILVATSVVEVGINVPNATVILIEGSERFGLAQLHQLRGRVQRSSYQSYCFLLPETRGAHALQRLRALEKSADGFALAERDLELRGAGDLYGGRQWGMSDLGMEALQNTRLIAAAREEATALIETDPTLAHHPTLLSRIDETGGTLHAE